jgi:hypothetical protein
MKVGDLVQYEHPNSTSNVGLIIDTHRNEYGGYFTVSVLWEDGDIWVHEADEFKVVSDK